MRAGVNEPVAVWWAPAEMPSLVSGLGAHRRGGPVPGAQDLPFRLMAEQHQQGLVRRVCGIDGPTDFRQPHLHSAGGQDGQEVLELVTAERSLVLTDDDRVERPVRASERGQQSRSLWTLRPRHAAGHPGVEERGDDAPVPGGQAARGIVLPLLGRCDVLVVGGRHAAVEREPHAVGNPAGGMAADAGAARYGGERFGEGRVVGGGGGWRKG